MSLHYKVIFFLSIFRKIKKVKKFRKFTVSSIENKLTTKKNFLFSKNVKTYNINQENKLI
jgi:hypothetical protein